MFDMMVPQGAPEGMENFTEMLQDMMPKRKKKRTVKVSEARRILLEQEFDKLVDMEDVTADALERVETLGIVFLDEIDKIAGEQIGRRAAPTCRAKACSATCCRSSKARTCRRSTGW